MQRAFGRAIRRARIPAFYSRGFNPHLIMSFASPLSVGYGTQADYLELEVDDRLSVQSAFESLRAAAPPGIEITGVYIIPEGTKKLMALNRSAIYEIRFPSAAPEEQAALREAAALLRGGKPHICTDHKGRTLDLGALILEVTADGGTITLTAANASSASLNPAVAAEELLKMTGLALPYEICRIECCGEKDGQTVPFPELFGERAEDLRHRESSGAT